MALPLSECTTWFLVGATSGVVVGQTILGLILSLHDGEREHIDPERR